MVPGSFYGLIFMLNKWEHSLGVHILLAFLCFVIQTQTHFCKKKTEKNKKTSEQFLWTSNTITLYNVHYSRQLFGPMSQLWWTPKASLTTRVGYYLYLSVNLKHGIMNKKLPEGRRDAPSTSWTTVKSCFSQRPDRLRILLH